MFEHIGVELGYDDLESITTEQGRRYVLPDGTKFPSITTVLSILSKDGIEAWRKRIGEEEADKISHRASQRGTAVHELIEKYINNDVDYRKGYTPNIISDFLGVKSILDERVGRVYAQEVPLYSKHLGVAGRVDCVAEFDGKISIIDFKTSRKPKMKKYITNYLMQETFYAVAWEERTGIPVTQLVTIVAVDENLPQVFIDHRDNWTKDLIDTIGKYNERQRRN